eukprot:763658-Hanusia_phi.AAC.8
MEAGERYTCVSCFLSSQFHRAASSEGEEELLVQVVQCSHRSPAVSHTLPVTQTLLREGKKART